MNKEQAEKKFPSYFSNFEMPEWAREQELEVYRACATGKIDNLSFLNTFEENGFQVEQGAADDDPQQYSLSSYTKLTHIKRFMTMDSRYGVPFKIAKGITNPAISSLTPFLIVCFMVTGIVAADDCVPKAVK